jgi:hypothetical protein
MTLLHRPVSLRVAPIDDECDAIRSSLQKDAVSSVAEILLQISMAAAEECHEHCARYELLIER